MTAERNDLQCEATPKELLSLFPSPQAWGEDAQRTDEGLPMQSSLLFAGAQDGNDSQLTVQNRPVACLSDAENPSENLQQVQSAQNKIEELEQLIRNFTKIVPDLTAQLAFVTELNDRYSSIFKNKNKKIQKLQTDNCVLKIHCKEQELKNSNLVVMYHSHTEVIESLTQALKLDTQTLRLGLRIEKRVHAQMDRLSKIAQDQSAATKVPLLDICNVLEGALTQADPHQYFNDQAEFLKNKLSILEKTWPSRVYWVVNIILTVLACFSVVSLPVLLHYGFIENNQRLRGHPFTFYATKELELAHSTIHETKIALG